MTPRDDLRALAEIAQAAGDHRRSCLAEGHELPGSFWAKGFAEIERMANRALAAAQETPQETRCTICREDYPTTGQQTRPIWEVWGPGYRVCHRCRQAALDAKRNVAHETPAPRPAEADRHTPEYLHLAEAWWAGRNSHHDHPHMVATGEQLVMQCDHDVTGQMAERTPAPPATKDADSLQLTPRPTWIAPGATPR